MLYHRGNERGIEVRTFQGVAVLKEEAKEWFESHPVAYPNRPCPMTRRRQFLSVEE